MYIKETVRRYDDADAYALVDWAHSMMVAGRWKAI
jgi:hypothetical protein